VKREYGVGREVKLDNLRNRMREMRFYNGELTQQEVADKLDVSRQTIHSIEKGKFNPSVKLALKIAELFKVKVEEIFYLEGKDEIKGK
jgi:putative transcriptional regulator